MERMHNGGQRNRRMQEKQPVARTHSSKLNGKGGLAKGHLHGARTYQLRHSKVIWDQKKNATDARKHLEKKQWVLPQQNITCSHLSFQGQRSAANKLPEATANVIKAVTFLEKAIVAQFVGKIMNHITRHDVDATLQVKDSIGSHNTTMQKQK